MLKARCFVLQSCVKIAFTWIYLLDGGQNAKCDDESKQRDWVTEFRDDLHDREEFLQHAITF